MGVLAIADADHLPVDAVRDEVHGDVGERRRDDLVERIGLAGPKVVGQLDRERLDPRPGRQLGRQDLADVGLVAVPECVGRAVVRDLGALPDRTLGRHDDGVMARRLDMVGGEHGRQPIDVVADLGNDAPGRRDVGGEQGREAGVAAEDPEDADPLVAAERRSLAIDELLGPGDGGREADAVLGPGNVVVHRLGNAPRARTSLAGEDAGEGQRVVAADRHEDIDAELVEVLQDERGEVEAVLVDLVRGDPVGRKPRWQRRPAHLRRVRPRRVQDRPARPVDGPGV